MKRDKISEAMGNISSRHIEEAAAFKVEEKKTLWVRWASIAACFCLIVVATFAIIPVFSDDENVNTGLPTDIDKIIWNNSSYAKNEYTEWNGFLIDTPLYDAFENSSDEYIAVVMTKADGKKIEESKYNEILEKTINREYKNENLYLFVTKEQFLNWKIENKSDYVFCLASRSSYEGTGTEVPTTSQTKESTAISPGVQNPSGQGEGHFSSYESILKLFRTAAYSMDTVNTNPRGLANGLFGIEDSPEKDWFMEIYYAIDYLYRNRSTPESKLYLGYAIKDLNRDGVDELVLIDKAYTVGAVFSQVNGKPVLLRAYEQRDSAWIDANGWLHENGSNGADYSTNAVYKIAEGGASLQLISEFGQDGTEWVGEEAVTIYYKLVNREKVRITEAEFVALEEQYGEYLGSQDGAAATKEQAGLSFVSLFADGITVPAFSHFTSYESILRLCCMIVEDIDFEAYDSDLDTELFGQEDSIEKEWFNRLYSSFFLFHPGRGKEDHNSPHYKLSFGYAIKDLNGDGVDELLLMTDECFVIAIFSMADGKPVLLGNYWERNRAWIDEKGWIHRNGSGGADCWLNAVYKIAAGGASFELIIEFGADGFEWVGEEAVTIYYKLVNGEKVNITEAEHDALEEEYGKYLGYDAGAEATKEQAGLTFVSLFADGITVPAFSHFTSYESILRLCRTAINEIDFENDKRNELATELFGASMTTEKDWFFRIYDSLFLFHPGRGKEDHNSPHYKLSFQYSYKDLNGDGIDELVLLTDEYIVIAVFSMADGKPVLLGDYQPRGSCWIDENGWLHINGSGGADCWLNAVYKIAAGGASFELITEFGADGFEWIGEESVTIYYKLVNGEKVNITEAEYDALEEQYGKYLGYEAGAEATKEKAGLEFIPLFKDTNDPQEMLKAALNNEIKVYRKVSIYPNKAFESLYLKDYYLADVGMYFGEYDERAGHEYALVDLDGDSCKELVINSYGIVILRYYHGRVYMYPFTARQMHHLYTDGSFPAHSQEDGYLNVIEYQLYFDGADFMQKELCRTVTKDESHFECYIDGKQVTEEEMEYYQKKHPKAKIEFTPEVAWDEDPVSFLSQSLKNTWKEDLIDLFSNLDIWIPGNVYGSYAVGLMDLNFDNTPEVLVAYPGGSMGNVWVEIYDLKSHDEPIICYNAMGYQNAVFLYVAKVGKQHVIVAEGSIRDPESGWCYCIESLSSDLYTGNLYLKTENLFAIADKINADGYGPYYYMGESVDKSKFDEEYQTFRDTYEVIRPTEMQMVMWSEFDLSNQEKAAREMANALVNTSQQFIEYKN